MRHPALRAGMGVRRGKRAKCLPSVLRHMGSSPRRVGRLDFPSVPRPGVRQVPPVRSGVFPGAHLPPSVSGRPPPPPSTDSPGATCAVGGRFLTIPRSSTRQALCRLSARLARASFPTVPRCSICQWLALRAILLLRKVQSWQHPKVFPGGPPP